MSKIEKAVQDLAVALEDLSVRVEKSVLGTTENSESLATAKNQARAAQKHAGKAALDLATVIDGLKSLIAKRAGPAPAKTADIDNGE